MSVIRGVSGSAGASEWCRLPLILIIPHLKGEEEGGGEGGRGGGEERLEV